MQYLDSVPLESATAPTWTQLRAQYATSHNVYYVISKAHSGRWRYYWYLIKVVLGSIIAGPLKMRPAT